MALVASGLGDSRAASADPGGDPLCIEAGRYHAAPEMVTDLQNGNRLWQRRVSARLSQPDAARYCADLVVAGMRGFHLPSVEELGSLRYQAGGLFGGHRHFCVPSIDQDAFPETPAAEFWTSRTAGDGTGWYVGFDDGRVHKDVQSDPLWVRCVLTPGG
jgi:hypothetical protein